MKARGKFLVNTAASLGMLIAVPGRLAYGILLVIELNVILLCVSLFMGMLHTLRLQRFVAALSAILLVSLVVLAKCLLVAVSPAVALSLGFALYFPALSVFVISVVSDSSAVRGFAFPRADLMHSLVFSAVMLAVFLFRDVLGYGTLTLPAGGRSGLLEVVLFRLPGILPWEFWATIPGAMILCAGVISALTFVEKRFALIERMEAGGYVQ